MIAGAIGGELAKLLAASNQCPDGLRLGTNPNGPYPTVTTVGLRNLTGVASGDHVTLRAATSTSGDNGADPNKVVVITEQPHPAPLVVAIVVDQLASWVLSERIDKLSTDGGFARLRR